MINRHFKDSGISPLVGSILLFFPFIGISVYLFYKTEFAVYIYIFMALTLISKLSESRRVEFLYICFGKSLKRKIRLTENLISAFPFVAFLLYKEHLICAFVLIILSAGMALVKFRTDYNITLWTPFSRRPYEYTTGFRKSFYLFIAAYILTIIAISVNNFNLGIFAMLFVFAITLSYYMKPENQFYVWIFNQSPRQFLSGKIKTALYFTTLLALPIILTLSIFYIQLVHIIVVFLFIGWAFLIAIIVTKYAVYPREMNIPQAILLTLCIWFPPLLLIIIPYLFKKSENNLKRLLT